MFEHDPEQDDEESIKKSNGKEKKKNNSFFFYNSNKVLIKYYESVGLAVKDLYISSKTRKKYKDKLDKNMYFYSKEI